MSNNDSMCDIICYFFIAKLQNFLIAPRIYGATTYLLKLLRARCAEKLFEVRVSFLSPQ